MELGAVLPYCSGQVIPVLRGAAERLGWGWKVRYFEDLPESRRLNRWRLPVGAERLSRWSVTGGLSGRECLRKSSAFFVYGFFHPVPSLMLRALRTGRPVLVLSEGLRERHNTKSLINAALSGGASIFEVYRIKNRQKP